jgi:hypothetical protein
MDDRTPGSAGDNFGPGRILPAFNLEVSVEITRYLTGQYVINFAKTGELREMDLDLMGFGQNAASCAFTGLGCIFYSLCKNCS